MDQPWPRTQSIKSTEKSSDAFPMANVLATELSTFMERNIVMHTVDLPLSSPVLCNSLIYLFMSWYTKHSFSKSSKKGTQKSLTNRKRYGKIRQQPQKRSLTLLTDKKQQIRGGV